MRRFALRLALLLGLVALWGGAGPAVAVDLKPGDLVIVDNDFGSPKVIIVDGATGFQTAIPVAGVGRYVIVTPDGQIVRTVGADVLSLDPVTGIETTITTFSCGSPPCSSFSTGLDIEDDGNLIVGLYNGSFGAYRVDPGTGSQAGLDDAGPLINGVAVAADGDIYTGPELGQHIIRIDSAGNLVNDYDMRPDFTRPEDLDVQANGELVIVEETDALFTLNPVTGIVTELVPNTVFSVLSGGVFAARDGTVLVAGLLAGETDWGIYSIDPVTGAHTVYEDGGLIGQPFDMAIVETRPCDDGADNDGDGDIDLADLQCADANDLSEEADCDDGIDNDLDGTVDLAGDPGCADANDNSELDPTVACDDGADNDGDGLADTAADPGCDGPADTDEKSPLLVCDDGVDNDLDGAIDVPADPGCESSSAASEDLASLVCDNGADDDGDLLADFPLDPGCADNLAPAEDPACDDNFDNDNDGDADWDGGSFGLDPDPGCIAASSDDEGPQCDDDLDNDGDGTIDWDGGSGGAPLDNRCFSPTHDREKRRCGLGFEIALLLVPLLAVRRRRGALLR